MVRPGLVDVSELDTNVDVDRPDVGPPRIRRHHVLKQRFSSLHRTVTEFQLGKLADHLNLYTQSNAHTSMNAVTLKTTTTLLPSSTITLDVPVAATTSLCTPYISARRVQTNSKLHFYSYRLLLTPTCLSVHLSVHMITQKRMIPKSSNLV